MRVTLRMPQRTVAKKNEATIAMLLLLLIMLFPPSMLVIIPWFLIQGSRRRTK
jgi:hypothetical protein